MATVVVGFGGALAALWTATGSVLNGAAVLGEAFGHGAQALNNLAEVAEGTTGVYRDESRAKRRVRELELKREYALLEASGPVVSEQ
jgi:hypothetical protein